MNIHEYVRECQRAPSEMAAVPVPIAAEYLGITREAVAERIRNGALQSIVVGGEGREWRLVPVAVLVAVSSAEAQSRERLVEPVTKALQEVAASKGTVPYGKLMERYGLHYRNPHHRSLIGDVLGDISERSWRGKRVLLSAIAVSKTSGLPNDAFFALAEALGAMKAGEDSTSFCKKQQQKVYRIYPSEKARGGLT